MHNIEHAPIEATIIRHGIRMCGVRSVIVCNVMALARVGRIARPSIIPTEPPQRYGSSMLRKGHQSWRHQKAIRRLGPRPPRLALRRDPMGNDAMRRVSAAPQPNAFHAIPPRHFIPARARAGWPTIASHRAWLHVNPRVARRRVCCGDRTPRGPELWPTGGAATWRPARTCA